MSQTGAGLFADVLRRAGVDTFFGLPGSTEAALLAVLRDVPGLRYVLGLHEGAIVSMADGYARVAGRPGVAGLHTSVGTMNGAAQIYNAYRDGSPVVVTAGHKDRTVLSEGGFCAHPHLPELVRPFTKWAHQSLSAERLGGDLWRALHLAMTPPTGPTYLAIPEDYLREPVPGGAAEPPLGNRALWSAAAAADPAGCQAAAAALASARWPVIVAGSQARGCAAGLRELAALLSAPVVAADFTDLADLPFPTASRDYFGLYGEDPAVLEGCDLVLAVGARVWYPFSAIRHPRLPVGARLIHIYPDPALIGAEVPTEVGIAADPAAALRAIRASLVSGGDAEAPRGRDQAARSAGPMSGRVHARAARLAELRAERGRRLAAERAAAGQAGPGEPLPVDQVAAELNQVLPPDAIIVDEGVRSSTRLLRHLEIGDGQLLLRSSGGGLGWGLPAAVGASLGQPGRPVVAIVGDGSFHFSVQAIWTAVQQGVPLVALVLDNGGYLAVKRAVESYLGGSDDQGEHPGTRLPGIDHAAVAAGYGAAGGLAARRGEVAEAVKHGLEARDVRVITVPVAQVRP